MRLTEEGNLGVGVSDPQAKLDVDGVIRARGGIQFSDGSALNVSPKGGLKVTMPSGKEVTVNPSIDASGTAR